MPHGRFVRSVAPAVVLVSCLVDLRPVAAHGFNDGILQEIHLVGGHESVDIMAELSRPPVLVAGLREGPAPLSR